MLSILAASVFLVHGAPLDMPRASAYLARERGEYRLIDRYQVSDLWTSQAVVGRWYDDDFRVFTWSRLVHKLPPLGDEAKTRADYRDGLEKLDRRDTDAMEEAVRFLSPVECVAKPSSPRQKIRGFKEVRYYQGTNETAIVCAYLPEKDPVWCLAVWELAEGDDFAVKLEEFERHWFEECRDAEFPDEPVAGLSERELLRRDVRHSVARYANWHCSEAEDFLVIDDLPDGGRFVAALTNEMATVRLRYRATVPSTVDASGALGVLRIFGDREEYLDVVGRDREWMAAYWCPERRELVAYMPEEGDDKLLRTIRHEAFHQYLAYAASMITASPWFNEGYAEYFEDEDDGVFPEGTSLEDLERYSMYIPAVMAMDYDEFYSGDIALHYRLAHSIARFLEKGAPGIRFRPFEGLKRDYQAALVETRDMKAATAAALKNTDRLKLLVAEWLKFHKNT